MKNSDIALVILIALMSFGISYFVMNAVLGNPNDSVEKIDYLQEISGTIEEPDHETFNAYALNLNEEVCGGRSYDLDEKGDVVCDTNSYNQPVENEPVEEKSEDNSDETNE